MRPFLFAPLAALLLALPAPANLLRNGSFQDDWLTLLPENKNHHWCYPSDFYNRRDFLPDGWSLSGSWRWLDADKPSGQRRLVLQGPKAEVNQRVNWVLVHDSRTIGGLADAGGFPAIVPVTSKTPLPLVRDLTFSVRLKGENVPAKAGTIEIGLCPPGGLALASPLGSETAPTLIASAPLPAGTYAERTVEVTLRAADWLAAARKAKGGPVLPGTVRVAVRYSAPAGRVELRHAELRSPGPDSPNLLPNGGFEVLDRAGWPARWGRPTKYRHFPGRLYYLFNTWHNSNADNRGLVRADRLVRHAGGHSLQMIVPSGDEVDITSGPVALNQKEARLLEVSAWVKTDRLCQLNVEAIDDKGERLDGHQFIHMAPNSIGTDEWRQLRQVFRPRGPLRAVRLRLCARGTNGYTLDDTGAQPQNNVVGTVWWDEVKLFEPESTAAELAARRGRPAAEPAAPPGPGLDGLDLGERLLGANVLRARLVNPGGAAAYGLRWQFTSPSGKRSTFEAPARPVPAGGKVAVELPYKLTEPCPTAYTEYRGALELTDGKGKALQTTPVWFATWSTPIDVDLGALYLRPGQKQFVRLNLGLSAAEMARLTAVRLEVVRRSTGAVVLTRDLPATPAAILAQREKLPAGLRDDLANLLLADIDVSALPLQPFKGPQRNWFVRATARAGAEVVAAGTSQPFCVLAHPAPQPAIKSVTIRERTVHVNGDPWLPWGAVYGHVPVYDGPADAGKGPFLDLRATPTWSIYDRFTAATYTRKVNDLNCARYVAGSITDLKALEKMWREDNRYCSSAFVVPAPVFSLAELNKAAGGPGKLAAYLAAVKDAPMVVSTAPGIEEAFGLFHQSTPAQLQGLRDVVDHLRKATNKPVMVGHGGYWNRLEWEKVPFFDIYDPETEPWYPANLHTDLAPLLHRKDQAVWLRPQMYESIPYERWRFHVYVELMRGARGWQIAHGPGDASLFRGLHAELELLRPALASTDAGPKVTVGPGIEHWSRRHGGKLYLIAATTRGLTLGRWRWDESVKPPAGRARLTEGTTPQGDESNSYGIGERPYPGPAVHGIQYLPDARAWPKGSKLVQWVRLDAAAVPEELLLLVKVEGRWTKAAGWGKDVALAKRADPAFQYWFLNQHYRHAKGFLGWGRDLLPKAAAYLPAKAERMGALPAAGKWVKLELRRASG
jgi:hypothetical protein